MTEVRAIRPQPGPQTAFAATDADIAIYGGSAGGGKSFALCMDVARYVDRVPRFSAIYLRRTYPELTGPDGLWDLSFNFLPHVGGTPKHGLHEWVFRNGSRVVMRHLQHEKDVYSHQGQQYAAIYFDELSHFTARQFWYMLSRNRSVCGVRPFIRASTNPDPDSFVAGVIDWWLDDNGDPIIERSGVLRYFVRIGDELVWGDSATELHDQHPGCMPLSFTFIAAKLADNPALTRADPGYEARLRALSYVERARLLGGNWRIRPAAGLYFKRHYFPVFDDVPGVIERSCRAWDKAATAVSQSNSDPDWTRGVLVHRLRSGAPVDYAIGDIASLRGGPPAVDRAMVNTAGQDGTQVTQACWVDPGQAGKVDQAHVRRVLDGHRIVFERASKGKEVYAGPVSSQAEGGRIGLIRGRWNDAFLSEVEQFPEGRHDDIVDAMSLAFLILRGASRRATHSSPSVGRSRWRV